ncbi:hypothetical protein B2K_39250 [Paenibacillus mucilaginosus K02]|uniref:Uncharacterized protein n=1 Tax=Paenibacillus mucilaginosus K02 TaxID=997761 RepID=R9ULE6_9BACL|nr:hypothetical protein B2K_39250 [Paenibacillus mucilaginosus K02]
MSRHKAKAFVFPVKGNEGFSLCALPLRQKARALPSTGCEPAAGKEAAPQRPCAG